MLSSFSRVKPAPAGNNERILQVRATQTRVLYENANTGIAVTLCAAPVLAYFQTSVVPYPIILGWLFYMLLISAARFVLVRRYFQSPEASTHGLGDGACLPSVQGWLEQAGAPRG